MDFRDTPDEAAFRAELRTWLRDNLPADWADKPPHVGTYDEDFMREWSQRLYDAGYVGLTWPEEFGGRGLGHTFQGIFLEESARAGAPPHIGGIGLGMAGPTIIAWGTHEQKARYLKPLLRGDEVWCQGFSEPGSGSDLGGARTYAERDGDEWVVNGQKVWSSWAHIADFCILVVRTDREAPKHAGLSYLLVDMKTPGVEVRPLRQITGDPEFNEIFFSDVRVPVTSILGNPGDGWKVAMTTLLHERGTLGFALTARLEVAVEQVIALAQQKNPDGSRAADDPVIRDEIAKAWIDLQSLRYTNYSSLTSLVTYGSAGAGRVGGQAALERGQPAHHQARAVHRRAGVTARRRGRGLGRLLAIRAAAQPRQHDRGGNVGDPAQHHRRTRRRAAQVPLTRTRKRS